MNYSPKCPTCGTPYLRRFNGGRGGWFPDCECGIEPLFDTPHLDAERAALDALAQALAPLTAVQRRRVLVAALRASDGN